MQLYPHSWPNPPPPEEDVMSMLNSRPNLPCYKTRFVTHSFFWRELLKGEQLFKLTQLNKNAFVIKTNKES